MYLPVQMGHAIHPGIGYIGDDTGENISERNGNFCELTGLYWAAKNLDSDYIGIVHYRRYFASRLHRFERKKRRVIGHEELNAILATTNVVLPKERHYFIETNYYNSGGSKLNEVARAYSDVAPKINQYPNYEFVWITDGQGWLTAKNKLEAAFNIIPCVYNLATVAVFIERIKTEGNIAQ